MRCTSGNHDEAVLLDYCAGRLDGSGRAMVDRHMAACPGCRELVRAQQDVWNSLDCWPEAELSPDFNRRLYARIEAHQNRWTVAQWWSAAVIRLSEVPWWPALPAAVACLAIVAWLLTSTPKRLPVEESQAKSEPVEMEQVERTLQDLEMLKQLRPKVPAESSAAAGSM